MRDMNTPSPIGRRVLGLAAVAFGIITVMFHDFNVWQQIRPLGNIPHPEILAYCAAAIEIVGGIAIQWSRTARLGAAVLGAYYLVFALLWVPIVVQMPFVYGRLGSFFEQLSIVSGALIVFSGFEKDADRAAKLARAGYYAFGASVVSFMLEQALYLSATADFVPKWMPPGQMFWSVATTSAFALAAIALFSGRYALLASRLLVAMILGFGILIWLPAPFADVHSVTAWAGNAQNLAIAAAAWIVAEYLNQRQASAARA
jgi:uncharacterized membrane protein YphA (DoxX/SURF4 family)